MQPLSKIDNNGAGNLSNDNGTIAAVVDPVPRRRWLYCYTPVIVVIAAIFTTGLLAAYSRYCAERDLLIQATTLGWDVVNLFSAYDKDGDNYLSLDEAEPLLLQFIDNPQGKDSLQNVDAVNGEEAVTIEARFIPLNISTMTKDFEHDIYNNASFYGLFNWSKPQTYRRDFGATHFKNLLPDLENIPVPGTVYTIVEAPRGVFATANLPSNRYFPPREVGRGKILHHLLSMFHPRPFLVMRFPPQGVLACVRAVSQDYVEVVFRMHIEFQLNDPPRLPFWFTPSQFTGSLIMTSDGSSVKKFHLYVPNQRQLNVDMEWLNERENSESMEVDIGYLPLMELVSFGTSRQSQALDTGPRPMTDFGKGIPWDQEISEQEAKEALELKLFPFKQVKYHNLSEAFALAQAESKLVHSILSWGALDDQSC